ncbi:MAG: glycosyltransferase [Candidatus Gracilibacteria bacterium]|nr:glycosyltransferase [Candidatus Gracilibacteria bacterium]
MFYPKVSIIIPVYNGSNYLAEAIKSALDQTYNNIEILVINDGSNDNGETVKVALSFGDKINYIYKENGGVATALNLGIEKASGEYISWLSHDDLYYPNKIEEQVKVLEGLDDKNTVIYSNFEFFHDNKKISEINPNSNYMKDENLLYNCIFRKYPLQGCSLLIKKDIFEKIGLFNIDYKCVQDYDMWLRMLSNKIKFKYYNKILIKYRRHENQGSIALNSKCFKEEYKNIYNISNIFNKFNLNDILKSSPNNEYKIILFLKIFKSFYLSVCIFIIINILNKLGIYSFLSPIWRKYILKQK